MQNQSFQQASAQKAGSYQRTALILILLLIFIGIGSLLWMIYKGMSPWNTSNASDNRMIADIYQDGTLLQSIPLSSVEEGYTLIIKGDNNSFNEIEVRRGSIGIITASCPDKLCVHQGFIDSSLLPITCLPNHLVIQLKQEPPKDDTDNTEEILPDVITY